MNEELAARSLVNQLKAFVSDKALTGTMHADLTDMLEACDWFMSAIGAVADRQLTRDELETLLIDIDVNMLQHLAHHIDSLKRQMPSILEAIAEPDGDETATPASNA
jgi:hypothetical protein